MEPGSWNVCQSQLAVVTNRIWNCFMEIVAEFLENNLNFKTPFLLEILYLTLPHKCVINFMKMDPVDKALIAYWYIIWETSFSIECFFFNGSSKHCIWYKGANRQRTEGTVLEKKETYARKRIPIVASFTRGRPCYSLTSYKTIR